MQSIATGQCSLSLSLSVSDLDAVLPDITTSYREPIGSFLGMMPVSTSLKGSDAQRLD